MPIAVTRKAIAEAEDQTIIRLAAIDSDADPAEHLPGLIDTHETLGRIIADLRLGITELHERRADPLDGLFANAQHRSSDLRAFDPEEAAKRIAELGGAAVSAVDELGDCPERPGAETDAANLSSEDQRRHQLLSRLRFDATEGRRSALIGNKARLRAVRALTETAPHFAEVIELVVNALEVSHRANAPLVIPPLLLLGEPGIGKTHFARLLAEALQTAFVNCPMNLSPGFGMIGGLNASWKGAKPGKVASTLVAEPTMQPVFVFDEIDKAQTTSPTDRPLDSLHSLWEQENAERFVDEYYDMSFDASRVISIATANAAETLVESLLDRLLVLRVPQPTHEQRRAIALQIHRKQAKRLGLETLDDPSDEAIAVLQELTPRRMARAIELALPLAIRQGRAELSADDLRLSLRLAERWNDRAQGMGFVRPA